MVACLQAAGYQKQHIIVFIYVQLAVAACELDTWTERFGTLQFVE
jgi:hypothetical protein